jgi:hypothetical protein
MCIGSSITLNAENAGASYLWNDGSSASRLEIFCEGEYSVEVRLNGCVARDTIYVTQSPVIQADFFYMQTTSCSPFITQFTELARACGASITEWSWDFGDGSTSTSANPISHLRFNRRYDGYDRGTFYLLCCRKYYSVEYVETFEETVLRRSEY